MLAFVCYLTSLLVLFKSFLLLVHHVIGSEDLVLNQATLGRFSLVLIFAKQAQAGVLFTHMRQLLSELIYQL
jgi:hypothetical protein